MKRKLPCKEGPNNKKKKGAEKGAQPAIQPGPQQQLEPIVTLGPEPLEVIGGYMAACEQAKKTSENKKKEADAKIEACEEGEILLFLRRVVESVVVEAQEKEAVADLKKIQPRALGTMMFAPMAAQAASVSSQKEEYDLNKAFDLGFGTPVPQQQPPKELYDLDDFPEKPESFVTPSGPPPVNKISRDLIQRCLAWAMTKKEGTNYEVILQFNGDFHLEVMRKHFRTMRPKKEIDLAMITAYSLVLNKALIPRFQSDIYILLPSALSTMLHRYGANFVDIETKKVYSVNSLQSNEHLKLVDNSKLINHLYWMYILDKTKKAFFVIDSILKNDSGADRTKVNRFAGNLINQLLERAGFVSFLAKATKKKPTQIS
ncbi:hypothetical protein PIB30_031949 [Stylosanthes scabra]|uniref:Uncharacterized protein n=1 Tax=Stylosanthes scabra TaxID=79078 RepID=A0ABU6RC69_9FABA|nr:hypothetical protein [Stylosanthes scabra]